VRNGAPIVRRAPVEDTIVTMRSHPLALLVVALATAAVCPAQLAGSYVVGPAGNFPDIASAISALTTSGVAGPVTFTVTANDTGPWSIPAFAGQGPANPVVFDAVGAITIGGTQPVLTLAGCASVTFRGFSGTFLATPSPSAFSITGSTADCSFVACDFHAPVATSGQGLIAVSSGTGFRIVDSAFGGAFEALNVNAAATGTVVERCRVLGGGNWIMRIAGPDTELVNNVITGNSSFGISCGVSGQPTSAANLKIRHNTIRITHNATTSTNQHCTLRWYTSAPGTEVTNNVLVDEFPGANGFNMWCSGAHRPAVMDFNCLWSNSTTYFPVFATVNQTFAAWQALGFDTNSIQADPLFVAPGAVPPDLSLQSTSPCAAAGTSIAAVPTDFLLAPRTVPVSIGAYEQDSGVASYTVFGAGCAGTAGVPTNTISAPPQLGTSPSITFGNLPAPNVVAVALGLSNTQYGALPLPFDLGVLGAPGCDARVSLDATLGVVGSAGTASLVFPIPNNPVFVGFVFHTQALVLDPPLNALGLSTSAAATAIVGL
jgi:hypothetical protein